MTGSPPIVLDDATLEALLRTWAPLAPVAGCGGLRAFAATDELPLWEALEAAVGHVVAAPFFAVAWPGAQTVASLITDGTIAVQGCRVLELGCGSGLVAVAAKNAGATRVVATDVDTLALQTTAILAREHGVAVAIAHLDLTDSDAVMAAVADADVVIAADVVYNRALGEALARLVALCARSAVRLVVADSGRPFFDPGPLTAQHHRQVAVPFAVEGTTHRSVTVYG